MSHLLGKVEGTIQNLAGENDVAKEQGNEDQRKIPDQRSSEVLPPTLHPGGNIKSSATVDNSTPIQLGTSVQDAEPKIALFSGLPSFATMEDY